MSSTICFLAISRVNANPQVGNLDLTPGLNLLGVPVDPVQTPLLADLLTHLGSQDQIKEIRRFNRNTGSFESCGYNPGGNPVGFGCNAPVIPGEGWLIHIDSGFTLLSPSTCDCPELILRDGLNLVALYCVAAGTTSYTLVQNLGGASKVSAVQTLDLNTGRWLTTTFEAGLPAGENFAITPGYAYIVYMHEQVVITPPKADAGADQDVLVGSTVQFQGSSTVGGSVEYFWSLRSVPTGSTVALSDATVVNPSLQVDKPGSYIVQLIVRDQLFASLPDTVVITVRSPRVTGAVNALLTHQNTSTGLIHSFPSSPIPNHSFTYDNAIVAMAFLSAGEIAAAEKLLDAYLMRIPNVNGGFLHVYSAQDASNIGGFLRTGHNSPLLQAMNLYFSRTGDPKYNELARQIATFIVNRQDSTDGGVVIDDDGGSTTKSTENNLTALSALQTINSVQKLDDPFLVNAANDIRTFLENEMWDSTANCFFTGKEGASINRSFVTDTQAFGAMVLGSSFSNGVLLAQGETEVTRQLDGGIVVTGFDLNTDRDTIWTEGTLHQALGFLIRGDTANAEFYTTEIEKLFLPSGQLPQATNQGTTGFGELFQTWAAAAPTAWYILVSHDDNVLGAVQ